MFVLEGYGLLLSGTYFRAVPIVHDNSKELADGTYNDKKKVMLADVYEYIVMTLEKAMELFKMRMECHER